VFNEEEELDDRTRRGHGKAAATRDQEDPRQGNDVMMMMSHKSRFRSYETAHPPG
jgi:hypothetical protein